MLPTNQKAKKAGLFRRLTPSLTESMKKSLRSIQTHLPVLHDLRFANKLFLMKVLKKPHESDFDALRHFQPKPCETFLDIGSNRGEAILSMLICADSQNEIIGFEPNPLVFEKLNNYYVGNDRVTVHNVGLADENSALELFVPFYRKWMFDGLSSFDFDSANDWLRTRIYGFNEKHLSIDTVRCQVRKLDDFRLNPYFIKIDVQGYELQVLRGAVETIKTHSPILLVESIDEETMHFLAGYNYDFFAFENNEFVTGKGELNTFCITESKLADLGNKE